MTPSRTVCKLLGRETMRVGNVHPTIVIQLLTLRGLNPVAYSNACGCFGGYREHRLILMKSPQTY